MRWQCGEKLFLEEQAEEAVRQQEEHMKSNPKEGIWSGSSWEDTGRLSRRTWQL